MKHFGRLIGADYAPKNDPDVMIQMDELPYWEIKARLFVALKIVVPTETAA